jgi:hypothetical protein
VLDPVSLLAFKLELAATLPQAKRQDVTHLKILSPCVRSFLGELLQQVEIGRLFGLVSVNCETASIGGSASLTRCNPRLLRRADTLFAFITSHTV